MVIALLMGAKIQAMAVGVQLFFQRALMLRVLTILGATKWDCTHIIIEAGVSYKYGDQH
jgi:hypothetical protein